MKPLLVIALITLWMSSCAPRDNAASNTPQPAYAKGLIAGPMLGYIEHREALVWIEVDRQVKKAGIEYYPVGAKQIEGSIYIDLSDGQTPTTLQFRLPELSINTTYQYDVFIDGTKQTFAYPTQFTTRQLWEYRTDAPDIAFLFGSCNYINDSLYDRPGEPYGQGTQIFATMAQQKANFMLWLGDNTYYRPADYSSASGMAYRNRHTRSLPEMQPILAAMGHYAIWDDHDFGANDADKTNDLKQESLSLFKQYWGNKTYGEAGNAGVYSKFQLADAEFYLLDDRYHRSPNATTNKSEKEFLGKRQLQWLKESLLASNKNLNFRFIAVGNQVLNPANKFECYREYQAEWQDLIDFIVKNRIEGVVFLTGDRHLTEINQYQPDKGFYTLYDVTSSPLTSRAFSNIADFDEYNNPARVDSTLLTEQNFIKATITGSFLNNNRTLTFTAIDATGKVRWTKSFHEDDLKIKVPAKTPKP